MTKPIKKTIATLISIILIEVYIYALIIGCTYPLVEFIKANAILIGVMMLTITLIQIRNWANKE